MFKKIIKPAQSLLRTTKQHFTNLQNISNKTNLNAAFPSDKQSIINNLRKESSTFSPSFLDNISTHSKLSKTTFSQTHRVFAKDLNRYMSLKTLHLDSPRAWEQMNLILRQKSLKKKALAEINSIYFNESDKIVNVLSECSSKVLSDSLRIRNQSKIPWKGDELTLLSWQILHQINAMQQLGGELHPQSSINPQNIFIDTKVNLLKLHDFGDFGLSAKSTKEKVQSLLENLANPPHLLNETILSLVNMISPEEWCRDEEAARRYLETHHSDFMYQLELIESKLREFDEGSKENFASRLENEILKILGDQKLVYENVEEYRREREQAHDVEHEKDHIVISEALKPTNQDIKSNEIPRRNQTEKDTFIPRLKEREQFFDEALKDLDQMLEKKNTAEKSNVGKDSSAKSIEVQDHSQSPPSENAGFEARIEEAIAKDHVCESAVRKIFRRIWQILNLKNSFVFTLFMAVGFFAIGIIGEVLDWVANTLEEKQNPPSSENTKPEKAKVLENEKYPFKPKRTFRDRIKDWLFYFLLLLLWGM